MSGIFASTWPNVQTNARVKLCKNLLPLEAQIYWFSFCCFALSWFVSGSLILANTSRAYTHRYKASTNRIGVLCTVLLFFFFPSFPYFSTLKMLETERIWKKWRENIFFFAFHGSKMKRKKFNNEVVAAYCQTNMCLCMVALDWALQAHVLTKQRFSCLVKY